MEQFEPLTKFYEAIEDDVRISASHISIYMALLQEWNSNGELNPLQITRISVMRRAKLNARSTYNKCINDLQEFGYIIYTPSNGSNCKSTVLLIGLNKLFN